MKSLQIELHSTNLLLWPPICQNKHAKSATTPWRLTLGKSYNQLFPIVLDTNLWCALSIRKQRKKEKHYITSVTTVNEKNIKQVRNTKYIYILIHLWLTDRNVIIDRFWERSIHRAVVRCENSRGRSRYVVGTIWPPVWIGFIDMPKYAPPPGSPWFPFPTALIQSTQSRHAWIQAFNYRFLEISVIWLAPQWGQTNFELSIDCFFKVQRFWKDHKIWKNLPVIFDIT